MTSLMTVTLTERNRSTFGRQMAARRMRFLAEEKKARQQAAATATRVSQARFQYRRPATAPPRPGRKGSGGRFRDFLTWDATTDGRVTFDSSQADSQVPYWIIQEIGTGEKATVKQGGAKNPQGRPAKGSTYIKTVRSQVGRTIPWSLVFATGPSGTYTPFGRSAGQQLFLRSQIKGAPAGAAHGRRGARIHREIVGQHFVQQGGEAGFREYKVLALAAARRAFAGQRYKP